MGSIVQAGEVGRRPEISYHNLPVFVVRPAEVVWSGDLIIKGKGWGGDLLL